METVLRLPANAYLREVFEDYCLPKLAGRIHQRIATRLQDFGFSFGTQRNRKQYMKDSYAVSQLAGLCAHEALGVDNECLVKFCAADFKGELSALLQRFFERQSVKTHAQLQDANAHGRPLYPKYDAKLCPSGLSKGEVKKALKAAGLLGNGVATLESHNYGPDYDQNLPAWFYLALWDVYRYRNLRTRWVLDCVETFTRSTLAAYRSLIVSGLEEAPSDRRLNFFDKA